MKEVDLAWYETELWLLVFTSQIGISMLVEVLINTTVSNFDILYLSISTIFWYNSWMYAYFLIFTTIFQAMATAEMVSDVIIGNPTNVDPKPFSIHG
jgi:hypothetical protein